MFEGLRTKCLLATGAKRKTSATVNDRGGGECNVQRIFAVAVQRCNYLKLDDSFFQIANSYKVSLQVRVKG